MSKTLPDPRAGALLPAHYWEADQPKDDRGRPVFSPAALEERIAAIRAAIRAAEPAAPRAWGDEIAWRQTQLAGRR